LAAFSSASLGNAKGWVRPRQVGVEIVSVWLLFGLAFILNLRLARVGCVSGRQFQSPKLTGLGFGIRFGGQTWDGRLAASESWAEVSLREFEFWLKQKGELVVELSQVFENRSVFISRPTQRAPDVWDSAAFSSIFLASGFLCSQALSTPAHTQVTQTVRRLPC